MYIGKEGGVMSIKRYNLVTISLVLLAVENLHAMEESRSLEATEIRDLRQGTPPLKELKYEEGDFFYREDPLTQIKHTLGYKGKEAKHSLSLAEKMPAIPKVIKDDNNMYEIIDSVPSAERASTQEKVHLKDQGIDLRYRISMPSQWPYSMQGQLVMTFPNGTNYVGSGILVGPHHVLTAGHNLYDTRSRRWATKVLFAPGRNEEDYPYANCRGGVLLCASEWVNNPRERDKYDFGMVILDSAVGRYTGWSGLLSVPPLLLEKWNVSVTGYPSDKGYGHHVACQMWTMKHPIKKVSEEQLFYEIDTHEGQSGGAIWGEWPGYEGYYTVGIHTGEDLISGEPLNQGIRLSSTKFDRIIKWIKSYQLPRTATLIDKCLSYPAVELDPVPQFEAGGKWKNWTDRARSGDREILYKLGELYNKGEGDIEKNEKEAFAYFYNSAKKNYPPALRALAVGYEKGQNGEKNLSKALILYEQAANKKDAYALRRLGICYLEGAGLPKSFDKALEFLNKASAEGDGEAPYRLGQLYKKGEVVTANRELAINYYEIARSRGYAEEVEEAEITFEEVKLGMYKERFHSCLKELKIESPSPSVFLCYYNENEAHQARVVEVAKDLQLSGIPQKQIIFDKWSARPGGGKTIFQHADQVFERADKVLMIGSPQLKTHYEKQEGGRGITTHQIENILTRMLKKDSSGIIPIWFEGSMEENIPYSLEKLQPRSFEKDYFLSFFELLEDIYQMPPNDNPVSQVRTEFERQKEKISEDMVAKVKEKIERENEERKKKDEEALRKAFGI
jgi:V8-like Glu-specific endopeptidase/tetratricopeptide (TPR) repeat protein